MNKKIEALFIEHEVEALIDTRAQLVFHLKDEDNFENCINTLVEYAKDKQYNFSDLETELLDHFATAEDIIAYHDNKNSEEVYADSTEIALLLGKYFLLTTPVKNQFVEEHYVDLSKEEQEKVVRYSYLKTHNDGYGFATEALLFTVLTFTGALIGVICAFRTDQLLLRLGAIGVCAFLLMLSVRTISKINRSFNLYTEYMAIDITDTYDYILGMI